MIEKEITIKAEEGLHARPAADFVKTAMSFKDTEIKVTLGEKEINAKSMMSVLSLGASKDSQIKIQASGTDEDAAIIALEEILS